MKNTLVSVLVHSLVSVMFLPGMFRAPQESEQGISIILIGPGEGETFYAGPSSLLYNIPIHGWVESEQVRFEDIRITLAIYQATELIGNWETHPDVNGAFEFYATVNPEASTEDFPATQADCSSYCHYLSEITLPGGEMRLELTAASPGGYQDYLERHVVVDRSEYASLALQVSLDKSYPSGDVLADIPVTASTRLYMWRSRHFNASTNDQGRADIRIEALQQSPTLYWLQVEPVIVNGLLYYSDDPVEVVLPPGANSAPDVVLDVRTRMGEIKGRIIGLEQASVTSARVLAIRPENGFSYTAQVSSQGEFVFENIPLFEYIVIPELENREDHQVVIPEASALNLAAIPTGELDFSIADRPGVVLEGVVRDENDRRLPFAWVTVESPAFSQQVNISSSSFVIPGLPARPINYVVSAPGYFSRAFRVGSSSGQLDAQIPQLVLRPETVQIEWGDGEIVIPPESLYEFGENRISFKQGRIWGTNQQASPITIQYEDADILLSQGSFAFENLPNRKNWLYVFVGSAEIHFNNGKPAVRVNPGEMVTFRQDEAPIPIPIQQAVITALKIGTDDADEPVWEPSLSARIRDGIASIGVSGIQVVTFITYGLILISIVIFPVITLYLWLFRREKPIKEEKNGTRG